MAHILLVDDHRAVRSALTRYLRLRGHTVTEVPNGRSALEKAGPNIDVVVTDLKMPGMGGLSLMRALRSRNVGAPIILMSGRFPRPEEAAEAAFVLQKPFDPEALHQAVHRVLGTEPEEDVSGA